MNPRSPQNVTSTASRTAEAISALTRLPLVAVLLFVAVGLATGEFLWSLLCIFLTSGLSLIYLLWLVRTGRVGNARRIPRAERVGPLRVVAALYVVSFVLLTLLNGPEDLRAMLLSFSLATVALALLTPFTNPSLHVAGISGTAVCVSYIFGAWGVPVALVILPVWWARTALGRHTPLELSLGMIVGAGATYVAFELLVASV